MKTKLETKIIEDYIEFDELFEMDADDHIIDDFKLRVAGTNGDSWNDN